MTTPAHDDVLNRALSALREQAQQDDHDLEAESGAVASWQGMRGWYDVSCGVRQAARRRRVALVVGLQLGLAVVGVGAWAAVSGRLLPLFSRRGPAPSAAAEQATPKPRHARTHAGQVESGKVAAASPEPPVLAPLEPMSAAVAPAGPSEPKSPTVRAPVAHRPLPLPAPSPPLSLPRPAPAETPPRPADDDEALYREAHAAHFTRRDYAAALVLWDAYLASNNGALTLEARYNRAIALVRLGRREEALAALRPFAAGEVGGYRQEEAEALLHKLATPAH